MEFTYLIAHPSFSSHRQVSFGPVKCGIVGVCKFTALVLTLRPVAWACVNVVLRDVVQTICRFHQATLKVTTYTRSPLPDADTDVSYFKNWITTNVQTLKQAAGAPSSPCGIGSSSARNITTSPPPPPSTSPSYSPGPSSTSGSKKCAFRASVSLVDAPLTAIWLPHLSHDPC